MTRFTGPQHPTSYPETGIKKSTELASICGLAYTKERMAKPVPKEDCMTEDRTAEDLTEDRRKEIFLALVEAQDKAMSVAQSRQLIAERFGVSDAQVKDIEREGLDNQWPPLD